MINILIVDDQKLIIEAWTNLLNTVDNFNIVSFATNEKEAIEKSLIYRPDIILLDINLGNSSGFDVCKKITNQLPKTKVIGLSLHDKVAITQKIIANGAKGYLTKNIETEELVEAIHKVYNGETYICKEMQEKFVQQMMFNKTKDKPGELTIKEIEILQLIARGLTSKEIGNDTFISPRTVDTHRHNILKKLSLPNTARLVSWAVQNGYLQ